MKNKSEIMYLIAFALYCFIALSGGSELIALNNTAKIVIYSIIIAISVFKIAIEGLTVKEMLIYLVIGITCMVAYIKLDAIFFIINFILIIAIRDVDIKKVVKLDIAIKSIFLITHVILYGIDYFFAYEKVQELIINHGTRIRHAFYFTHPNIICTMVFWIIMDIYYLKENIKLIHIIIGTLGMLVIYSFAKSRTVLILYVLFLFILCVEKLIKNKAIFYKMVDITHKFIFEIVAIASIAAGLLYKYNFYLITTVLNKLTSGRVYSSYAALTDYGINLLYNIKAINLEKHLLVDNFYVRCAALYGLIFVILLAIMTKLIKSKNNKNVKEKIMIIILAVSLFSEYFGIIIGNAIPLLLLGNLIINKEEENEKTRTENIDYYTDLQI